jgi:hypothetical protein
MFLRLKRHDASAPSNCLHCRFRENFVRPAPQQHHVPMDVYRIRVKILRLASTASGGGIN